MSLTDHWNDRYENNPASKLSWYQERSPEVEFITSNVGKATPIIDIGGGLSPFVHDLIDLEFTDLTVLDISDFALSEGVRKAEGRKVEWIASDIREWSPDRMYGLWHDRAVFHFLTEKEDQQRYFLMAAEALVPGGYLIMGTFSENGPEECSGLSVARHSIADLTSSLAVDFTVIDTSIHEHITPSGAAQEFAWVYAVRN
jgi:SAM-dependent methyltransferase